MNVGDYIRTEDGKIAKVIDIEESLTFAGYEKRVTTDKFKYSNRDMVIIKKSSPNIIDLIEVGDYVNGEIVNEVWEKVVLIGQECVPIKPEDIKSIVTKEQFKAMQYNLESQV